MALEIKNAQDLLEVIIRRKWCLLLPALGIFLLSAMIAFSWPRTYRSSATILIEDQEVPRDFVNTTVTSFAEQRMQQINQRIMGTTRMLQIINKFNLYPELRNKWATEEIIEKLRKDIKLSNISADVIDPRSGMPRPATIAFTLSYKGRNPQLVQQVASELTSLYLEENLKVREQQSGGTTKFMEEEMKTVQKQLADADAQISSYKQRHVNTLPELAQVNLQSVESVDREIISLNYQLRTLREKESTIQAQLATIPTDAANQDKVRLNELRVRLGEMKTRLTDAHPDVVKTKSEVAELYQKLKATRDPTDNKPDNPAYITLSTELSGIKSEIESTKKQVETFTRKRDEYLRRISATPLVEEGYKKIFVQRNNLQLKYDDLSKKFMEAKVSHGLEKEQKGERFTLIDAARLPELPINPNIHLILLVGIVLGMGSGIGLAAYNEQNDQTARSPETLAKSLGLPVLASIPELLTERDFTGYRVRQRKLAVCMISALVFAPLIIHFLVMDLDMVWAKLLRRMAKF